MKTTTAATRKRPVNLTMNEALVAQAKAYTPHPSASMESLLAEFVAAQQNVQRNRQQAALAWLLQRSPNILLIPGTSSVVHLRENLAAGQLRLSSEALAQLEGISNEIGL
jgi:aryl-alcohol dehydrogenase-like predicted oxidoreductase